LYEKNDVLPWLLEGEKDRKEKEIRQKQGGKIYMKQLQKKWRGSTDRSSEID
jgi:hypothetical protein